MKTLSEVLAHLVNQSNWFSEADRDDALETVSRVADVARAEEKEWTPPTTEQAPVAETSTTAPTAETAPAAAEAAPIPGGLIWSTSTAEPPTTSDSSSEGSSEIAASDVTQPAPEAAPVAGPAVDETVTSPSIPDEASDLSGGPATPLDPRAASYKPLT